MSDVAADNNQKKPKEVQGIRLKHFEHVLWKLLSRVEPTYIPLPEPSAFNQIDWDALPSAARVHGNLPGQLADKQRAMKKDFQVKSLLRCLFALLPPNDDDSPPFTVVDFGGGSGNLSLPLALSLPNCNVVVVDLKERSLELLHQKARKCACNHLQGKELSFNDKKNSSLRATAVPNLFTFSGAIESYNEPFDIGVALHVCGEATDVVLRKCAFNKAHLILAPCCVGKLSSASRDIYKKKNIDTIEYPQSRLFHKCLQCSSTDVAKDWNALAKAADYNAHLDMNDGRNACRRTAKGLLELDRKLFLQEKYSYQTALTRMEPLTASPKNDILIGYCKTERGTAILLEAPLEFEDPVVAWTKERLLNPGASPVEATTKTEKIAQPQTKKLKSQGQGGVDWTWQEEQEIRNQLTQHFSVKEAGTLVFPTGMNRRKRKLCHFVADQLNLAHWSVGKKHAERTVSVRRRYVQSAQATEA